MSILIGYYAVTLKKKRKVVERDRVEVTVLFITYREL